MSDSETFCDTLIQGEEEFKRVGEIFKLSGEYSIFEEFWSKLVLDCFEEHPKLLRPKGKIAFLRLFRLTERIVKDKEILGKISAFSYFQEITGELQSPFLEYTESNKWDEEHFCSILTSLVEEKTVVRTVLIQFTKSLFCVSNMLSKMALPREKIDSVIENTVIPFLRDLAEEYEEQTGIKVNLEELSKQI